MFANLKKDYTFALALVNKAHKFPKGIHEGRPIRLSARTQDFHS